MISAIVQAWKTFWFARIRLHPLGIIRVILPLWLVLSYVPKALDFAKRDAVIDPAMYSVNPGNIVTLFPYPPTGDALTYFGWGLYLFGILSCIGLFARFSTAVFGLALLYAFSGFASHAYFDHEQVLTLQVLLILAVAPGSTGWSLDRLLSLWRFSKQRKAKPTQRMTLRRLFRHVQGPAVPRWGLQLVLIIFVVVYTTAGVSKVRFSDGQWFDGQSLKYYLDGTLQAENEEFGQVIFGDPVLAQEHAWKDDAGLSDHAYGWFSNRIYRERVPYPAFYTALASATVIFELVAFLMLCGTRWRNLYLIGAFGMHSSIGFSMHLPFNDYRMLILLLISYGVLWQQACGVGNFVLRRRKSNGPTDSDTASADAVS